MGTKDLSFESNSLTGGQEIMWLNEDEFEEVVGSYWEQEEDMRARSLSSGHKETLWAYLTRPLRKPPREDVGRPYLS